MLTPDARHQRLHLGRVQIRSRSLGGSAIQTTGRDSSTLARELTAVEPQTIVEALLDRATED